MLLCYYNHERKITEMKKISLLLAVVILATSICFIGCETKKKETKPPVENPKPEVTTNNLVLEESDLLTYFQNLESAVEEQMPKQELDKEILATVNGLPIYASGVRYTTMVLDGFTPEEAKAEEETFFKENAALVMTAYENGIEFTDDNATKLKADITGMQLQLGDEYDNAFAESPYTKFFYYFQLSAYSSLYNNLYEKVLADRENEMTKTSFDEAKGDMVRAKHILIQFPEGEGENGALTDEQKAATLEEANSVLDKVNAMSDISEFDALIAEYNDDPGMQANPDGYYFGRGEMVPEFEESAYSLAEYETSGLVETSYGYHILLKLPLEDDEAIYNSTAFSNILGEKLYESISAKTEGMEIVYGENYDARVAEFKAEYEALKASAE
ncbi:MAG: hypothetical protein E7600_02300 [Ruminococcaceae bacterium]|nr:hypothetical protein [Oscillospiraceae bacterium]